MAHVGLEWSHDIAYYDTGHKRGQEGRFLVDRRGHQSSKGMDCDIPALVDGDILVQGLIELI
jgi:hypothetical protein